MGRRSGKFYNKNERETLKRYGFTPTVASGAGNLEKEDGFTDAIIVQHKSTDAMSYSIKLEDIRKLELHAAVDHKIPMFMVQFLENDDVFFIMRPEHVEHIWKYLMDPKSSPEVKPEPQNNIIELSEAKPPRREMIKSGNKQKLNQMFEKERQEKNDKYEAKRRDQKKIRSK